MARRHGSGRSLRTVGVAAAAAILIAVFGAVSPGAATPSGPFGRFAVVCELSHQNRSDPIVFPGIRKATHLHQFFGNRSTGPRSRPRSLRRAQGTTCSEPADRSAYWVPTLFVRGEAIRPKHAVAYYHSDGKDPAAVKVPPRGLRMVSGDSAATVPQDRNVTTWRCFFGPLTDVFGGPTQEPVCGRGATLVLAISFPDCWNGRHLDSPDHQSHMAYSQRTSSTGAVMSCPASHPVSIPAIDLEVAYPVSGAMPGGELSSGGVYSGHGDFMDGWVRRGLGALVAECIQRGRDCGIR